MLKAQLHWEMQYKEGVQLLLEKNLGPQPNAAVDRENQ